MTAGIERLTKSAPDPREPAVKTMISVLAGEPMGLPEGLGATRVTIKKGGGM